MEALVIYINSVLLIDRLYQKCFHHLYCLLSYIPTVIMDTSMPMGLMEPVLETQKSPWMLLVIMKMACFRCLKGEFLLISVCRVIHLACVIHTFIGTARLVEMFVLEELKAFSLP